MTQPKPRAQSNQSALKKLRKDIFSQKNPSKQVRKQESLNLLKTNEKYKILGKKRTIRTIIPKKVELPERVHTPGFKDRRVGVMNHTSTKEQIFNLEEPLTHMGNELDYDNLSQLSDDDNNYDEHMEKDMTTMNFGGFEEQDGNSGGKKTRNEIMKEVIMKSKTFKRERQMQKEMDLNVQEDLDKDLDEIRGMLAPMPTRVQSEGKMVVNQERLGMLDQSTAVESRVAANTVQPSDYDKVLRELAFEKRARPTDRQKTEEELAIDMKNDLEEQEAKRIITPWQARKTK